MVAWPDAPVLEGFLRRATRRRVGLATATGAAAGLAGGVVVVVAGRLIGWPPAVAVVLSIGLAASVAAWRAAATSRRAAATARLVERVAPAHNVLVTAAELITAPGRVPAPIGARVVADATRAATTTDLARVFPAARPVGLLAAAAVAWGVTVVAAGRLPVAGLAGGDAASGAGTTAAAPAIGAVHVRVTPPAYTGRAAETLDDPPRLEVLAGSRLDLDVDATAATLTVETMAGSGAATGDGPARFRASLVADRDGFIAIEPHAADGSSGTRRILGLVVTPDRAPAVRITEPARDLFLAQADRALDVALEADDDLGLKTLALTYTKVSGSGENFAFTSGEVVVAVTRTSDRAWSATGALPIDTLGLEPGDMVVYRGVATDARPGATPVESDAFIVEITAPGSVAAEGFAIDDQRDRYALSQRMVIIKTERLLARRASMTPEAVAEEAASIAAEQRQVRAEFVFMMGGELEEAAVTDILSLDEEAHAENDADIAAGRNANQGRLEIVRALRFMSQAAAALVVPEIPPALDAERQALDALQRAFTRSRYILRTMTQRESLDLARRMTGTLADLGQGRRPAPEPAADPTAAALRTALARTASLAAGGATTGAAAEAAAIAQDVLRLDPGADAVRRVADALTGAARAFDAGDAAAARDGVDQALVALSAAVRARVPRGAGAVAGTESDRLQGALADAMRGTRAGGGR
ncbi:MAG: hypothetical protein R2752_02535 [Vicinamibacterales bacterium]